MHFFLGNPHNWFHDEYLGMSEIDKATKEKSKQAMTQAKKMLEDATNKFDYKKYCTTLKCETRKQYMNSSDLTTPIEKELVKGCPILF